MRALPLLITLLLVACSDDTGQNPGPSTCTDKNTPAISSELNPEHRHRDQGFVCEEDRGNGLVIPLRETRPGQEHGHEYTLTEQDVRDILDGKFVRKATPFNLGHSHVVTYNPR